MEMTYNLREVLRLEENKKIEISSKYTEGIVNFYRNLNQDERFSRTERCGKHILSAIGFRENAKSTFEKTKGVFLPSVGYYYSYFHLSIAMLSLDYATPIEKLENLKHTQLLNLIENNLEKKKIINNSFLTTMKWLKKIRETSNYSVNPFLYDSTGFLKDDLYDKNGIYNLMEDSFNEAINYIHFVTNRVKKKHIYFGNRIESFITDSQGDDIIDVYFPEDADSIEKYLAKKFYPGLSE
jgi:hypothetical protein